MTDPTDAPPPCILSYGFATAPAPLQASGPSQPSPGMVNVWVSATGSQPIYCNRFMIAVPVGNQPKEFSTVAPTLTPNTQWWVVAGMVMDSGAALGLPQDPGLTYAIFTVTCPSPDHWKIDYRLIFSLATTSMSTYVDEFPYTVVEYSAYDSPDTLVERKTVFTLSKADPELYLANLVTVSASQSTTTTPRTEFGNGEAIRLLWESNGTTFSLYQGGRSGPIWTGPDTSYTVTGGVATGTTFTVVTTMDGAPGSRAAATAVTVSNPTLTPASSGAGTITVTGTSNLGPQVLLGTTTATGLRVATGLARLGQVNASSITAMDTASFQTATMAGATVQTTMSGPGRLQLADATTADVGIGAWFQGLVGRAVNPNQNYVASTDGFLVGAVAPPTNPSAQISTRIAGSCSGIGTVYAQGGNTNFYRESKKWWMWEAPNTFLLPVPKGATFNTAVTNRFGTGAVVSFQWYALGVNATLTKVAKKDAQLKPPADAPPVTRKRPDRRRQIERVAAAFARIAGDAFTPELRARTVAGLEVLLMVPSGPPPNPTATPSEPTELAEPADQRGAS